MNIADWLIKLQVNYIIYKWRVLRNLPYLLGVALIFFGLLGYIAGPVPYVSGLYEFYQEIRSELIGIGLAVIIIDYANAILRKEEEKNRLVLQMGSSDNAFALEAARQLFHRGWLNDGTTSRCGFYGANLKDAYLIDANLRGSQFRGADLDYARLGGANLYGADLRFANLEGAWLGNADLRGARLGGARLIHDPNWEIDPAQIPELTEAHFGGANLNGAVLKDVWGKPGQFYDATLGPDTIMPDGERFDPEIHEEWILPPPELDT